MRPWAAVGWALAIPKKIAMAKIAIATTSLENEAKAGGLIVEGRIVVSLPYIRSNKYVGKVKYIRTLRRRGIFT